MRSNGSLWAWLATFALGAMLALGWASPSRADDGDAAEAAIGAVAPLVDGLRAHAGALLNGVRAQVSGCEGTLPVIASIGAGAGLLAVERPVLRWNPQLAEAAQRHADAMARTRLFDHVGADGSTVRERVDATGYRWQLIGENLAAGQGRLEEAVVDWLKSESHCAALLDARYTEFGLARIDSDSPADAFGTYWTLVLGRPR